jgi:hypothetical protein
MQGSFLGRLFSVTLLVARKRRISFFALFCLVVLQIGFARRVGADPTKPNHPDGGHTADPSKSSYLVTGHIGAKYKALKGSAGPLGHPTSKAMYQTEGKGLYQAFEHGVIGWTPSTGQKSVQALYLIGNELHFEWDHMAPVNYDFWLVRWDLNGQNVGQQNQLADSHYDATTPGYNSKTAGKWVSKNINPGHYRLVVEGGFTHGLAGTDYPQGWSNPLYIHFVHSKHSKP